MQNESRFKLRVLRDLKAFKPSWVLKTQERARRGVPDIFFFYKGHCFAIELKVEGEKPDALQAVVLKRIQATDNVAFYTTPDAWEQHLAMLQSL